MAKPKREVYEVTPKKVKGGTDWLVKKEGGKKAVKKYKNKTDAIKKGRKLAQKPKLGQLKIKKSNGEYQKEYTYGQDPEKYKS